ncbi:hypothetical protein GCM10010104_70960 [Streptomyces indiaensis]|uniref:Uncharacterized protein n=1 Tax=Streptomyces indiaensis TaxID=284033 RepID=A0ABN3ENR4_9ACTN
MRQIHQRHRGIRRDAPWHRYSVCRTARRRPGEGHLPLFREDGARSIPRRTTPRLTTAMRTGQLRRQYEARYASLRRALPNRHAAGVCVVPPPELDE